MATMDLKDFIAGVEKWEGEDSFDFSGKWKRQLIHKRKQYNKRNFCELKVGVDPCELFLKTKKIPEDCNLCSK